MTSEQNPLQAALAAIAVDDPDRAQDANAVGFNKPDGWIGHSLATIPDSEMTPEQRWTAYTLARKYQRQLNLKGIDFKALPVPPEVKENARQKARSQTYQQQVELKARDSRCISVEKGQFVVRFVFDNAIKNDLKDSTSTRRYTDSNNDRRWTVEFSDGQLLYEFAKRHEFQVSDEALEYMRVAPEPAEKPNPNTVTIEGDRYAVRSEFDWNLVNQLKEVPGRDWVGATKTNYFPLSSGDILYPVLQKWGFDIPDDVEDTMFKAKSRAKELRELSRALDADIEVPGFHGEFRPFQRAGIKYALTAERTIIADETGLGKTIQALGVFEAANAYPAVVLAPYNAKRMWARAIRRFLPQRTVAVLDGNYEGEATSPADIVVLNYDIAYTLETCPTCAGSGCGNCIRRGKNKGKQVKVRPDLNHPWKALAFDEGHRVKNKDAMRSQVTDQLSELSWPYRLDLTATPSKSRNFEFVNQLDILGQLDALGGFWHFVNRYCGAFNNGYGWDFSGSTNSEELNRLLRETCLVRRTKAQVFPDLPPIQRDVYPVQGEAKAFREYKKAEDDVVKFVGKRAAQIAEELGEDPNSAAVLAMLKAERAEHLVRIGVLKRLAAKAKIPAFIEWTQDFFDVENFNEGWQKDAAFVDGKPKKLLVFADTREVIDELAHLLHAPKIYGGVSGKERERIQDAFQEDTDTRVLILGIRAASESITLTAADDVVFIEQDWNPGEHDQAEGRSYGRVNDPHAINSLWFLAEDTIDFDINELIEGKRVTVTASTDGNVAIDSKKNKADEESVKASLFDRLVSRSLVGQK